MINRLVLPLAVVLAATAPAFARGGHSGGFRSSGGSHSSRGFRSSGSGPGEHYTKTYVTKRGTVVAGHYDTNPDGHFGNNYSTKGNVNPHTGQEGTKVTPPNGEPN